MEHTKGNWKVEKSGNPTFDLAVVTDKDGGSVCHVTQWSEDKANAKLMAASPKMLEALNAVVLEIGVLEHNWDYRQKEFMSKVMEALKKATE